MASIFSGKISKGNSGRKRSFEFIQSQIPADKAVIWFHAASLGEFEQGRPLIKVLKNRFPESFILQSFFSPSGYEIRKNDPDIDLAIYLPIDTPRNAKRFLHLVRPQFCFFIKYEFWFNYLEELTKNDIPTYYVSSVFKKDQYFFKWYGKWFRDHLHTINHLFLQDENSSAVLNEFGITNHTISGDSRYDNVIATLNNVKPLRTIEQFKGDHQLLVLGSTWPVEEDLIMELMSNPDFNWKVIIAPHELNKDKIDSFAARCSKPALVYSKLKNANLAEYDVLIIDNIGMLNTIYQYAELAYIGGGFGKGIHNALEAAVFAVPVLFGPNKKLFIEADEFISKKVGKQIDSNREFVSSIMNFIIDEELRQEYASNAANYIKSKAGATQLIEKHLFD